MQLVKFSKLLIPLRSDDKQSKTKFSVRRQELIYIRHTLQIIHSMFGMTFQVFFKIYSSFGDLEIYNGFLAYLVQ